MDENTNKTDVNQTSEKMTDEQKFFAVSIKFINEFDEIEKTRELTAIEKAQRDKIYMALWNKIIRYARSLIASSLQNYIKYNDYMSEITQSIAAVFFSQLPYYDPRSTAPITYFTPYFLQEISKYKRNDSQHMTQNEANNTRKVRQAVRNHESRNEAYDYQIISVDTGLSINVVKKTFERMSNSHIANIDDMIDLVSNSDTPEQVLVKDETKTEIWNTIDRVLDEDEKIFLFTKLNLDEKKEKTYKALADTFNMEIHDVKAKWSNIQMKLASDPILQKMNPSFKEINSIKLNTHTSASDDMADDLLNNMDFDFKIDE